MNTLVKIYGIHVVAAIIEHHSASIQRLLMLNEYKKNNPALEQIYQQAKSKGMVIEMVPRVTLDRESNNGVHQGVIAVCTEQAVQHEGDLEFFIDRLTHPPTFLILDQVQDPHNLGACFRNANALGADAIIVPKNNASGLTASVHKAASGAALFTPFFQVTNLTRTLQQLKEHNIWIYGLAAEAEKSMHDASFGNSQGVAVVLGAEGAGLRRLTREQCDELLHIPMQGQVSSLNVSVAAGIVLMEVLRQRTMQL